MKQSGIAPRLFLLQIGYAVTPSCTEGLCPLSALYAHWFSLWFSRDTELLFPAQERRRVKLKQMSITTFMTQLLHSFHLRFSYERVPELSTHIFCEPRWITKKNHISVRRPLYKRDFEYTNLHGIWIVKRKSTKVDAHS